jgi:hypothetical protein
MFALVPPNLVTKRLKPSPVAGRMGSVAVRLSIVSSLVPCEAREAFHNAVWLYADWTPSLPEPIVRLGGTCRSMSAVCGLVVEFNDRLPDDVFDRLMIYLRRIRYTLLRQKIFAEHSYAEGGRCFLRLIEDRKRQRR